MPHAKSFIGFQGQVDWILVVEEVREGIEGS